MEGTVPADLPWASHSHAVLLASFHTRKKVARRLKTGVEVGGGTPWATRHSMEDVPSKFLVCWHSHASNRGHRLAAECATKSAELLICGIFRSSRVTCVERNWNAREEGIQ